MRNSEGNVIGFANITRDLTERRRAEEALKASEVRWRTMFEKSPVGIVLRDADHRYMAANPAFQQMVGYSEQELARLTPLDITHEDDRTGNHPRRARADGTNGSRLCLNSCGKASGVRISDASSGGPASIRATFTVGSPLSRAASTQPADPPPTMM